MRISIALIAILLTAINAGAFVLRGSVTNGQTHEKIPFATVTVTPGNHVTQTDASGNFHLDIEGGRYTLAVVANGRDYDLIYISGAQVNPSDWHMGMLKGRITKTIFGDHYDLFWIDATGMPIAHDAYATVDNGVLLTLRFPVYNSQIRLSKQISAE